MATALAPDLSNRERVAVAVPPARRAFSPRRLLSAAGLGSALTLVCLWVLWRTGPGKVPYLADFEQAARSWPNSALPPDSQYILRVPLGQLLYRLLPQHSLVIFLLLHAACVLLAVVLLGSWLCRRLGRSAGLVAAMVVALAPVTAVLLLWIGMYDAFSILVWVAVLIALGKQGGWQFAAALVAGLQDFEQMAVGLALVVLVPQLAKAAGLRPRTVPLLVGVLVGKGMLEVYLYLAGAGTGSRLSYLLRWDVFSGLVGSSLSDVSLLLWSALAGLWGFALKALYDSWGGWSPHRRAGLVLATVLWLGSSVLSADHTRVLALTSFPLVVMGAMAIGARWPNLRDLLRLPQTWLLMLAPPVVLLDYTTVQMGIKPGTWGVWIF